MKNKKKLFMQVSVIVTLLMITPCFADNNQHQNQDHSDNNQFLFPIIVPFSHYFFQKIHIRG